MNSRILAAFALIMTMSFGMLATPAPVLAQEMGEVPGQSLGINSDADLWRFVRTGNAGSSSMKNELGAVMIQSEGDNWRALRNGPVSTIGAFGMFIMLFLLTMFYMIRGKIKIEKGPSGKTILRFGSIDRFAHWLMAGSFVVLGLTGLNMLYGRYVLLPVIGPEAYSALTAGGKFAHNYLAFAFMLGLALSFVLWVRHNIPTKIDLQWLRMGGGIFKKGVHPPAKKFNAGQKIIFWATMVGGLSISMSGIALMFPFQTSMFADTFALLNNFGFALQADLTPLQEQQYNQLWHGIVSLVLVSMIIAHIYIGSLGMEGAHFMMIAHLRAGKHVTVGAPDGGQVFLYVLHPTVSALSKKEACFRSKGASNLPRGGATLWDPAFTAPNPVVEVTGKVSLE
ncbi:MAG: formate dehydrogenase subunit gamma [Proteobacteria bacterium]|nr:formate dehydrogenase subunit gamma [Pseudomonadota bacterium]